MLTLQSMVLLALIILPFQNCTNSDLQSTSSSNIDNNKFIGGNGEPYDGKLSGYSRLVPGLICENQMVAMGTLEIHGNYATLVTNENSCQNLSEEVPISQLEFSSFSKKYIGYDGGVYTYLENRTENINKGIFTEAWCRAMKSDGSGSSFEFAVEWQEAGHIARFSQMTESNPSSLSSTATRELEANRVSYFTSEGKLVINYGQKNSSNQKILGEYTGKIDGKDHVVPVQCLMGGQFDSKAPQFDYPYSTDQTLAVNEDITTLLPIVNKSTVTFALRGTLPEGLFFDKKTGAISGKPKAPSARKNILITAQFNFGEVSRELTIGVGDIQIVDQKIVNPTASACLYANGNCDLGGAIAKAKKIAPIPLIVRLGVSTIDFNGSGLNIEGDLSIIGLDSKTTLDAHSLSRHFNLLENAHLDLKNLILINGKDKVGGSINASFFGNLSIRDSSFRNNLADNGISRASGGAIAVTFGTLAIVNSEFVNNRTGATGQANRGGAVEVAHSNRVSIKDTLFKNNYSPTGGALYFFQGNVEKSREIINCTFEANSALRGGAIGYYLAETYISKSRFINNSSAIDGSAIDSLWSRRTWISESEFIGNTTSGDDSSVISWKNLPIQGLFGTEIILYILESKFSNNKLTSNQGSVILNTGGQVFLRGSTFSNNGGFQECKAVDLAPETSYIPPPAKLLSLGGNSSSDGTCP